MRVHRLRAFTIPLLAAVALPAWSAPGRPPAQSAWLQSAPIQRQLTRGQVVSRTTVDEQRARASVDAAIRIRATPASVWPLITECSSAALLMPQIKHCELLQSAPDGSWAVIEHDIKYSVFSRMVHSVFRADLQPPYSMQFHRIRGDLKDEVGSWTLVPSADGVWTTVEYQVAVEPGFWVPRALVRHSLRKQLPAALLALRGAAEHGAATPVEAATTPPADSLATGAAQ